MKSHLWASAILVALPLQAVFAADTPSAQDKTFVQQAAEGGMAEVQEGQLASSQAQSDKVKQFGQKMVKEHTENNQELMTLAQKKGLTPAAALDDKHTQEMAMLQKQADASFDHAYIMGQVTGHQAMASVMQTEIQSGSDPDLKAFAQKTLPVVQQHLQMAQQLQGTSANAGAPTAAPMTTTDSDKAPNGSLEKYHGMLRASEMNGANVYNDQGNAIGTVNDLLVGDDGKIQNVVLSVGGFLGIGTHYVSVPFSQLQVQPSKASGTGMTGAGGSSTTGGLGAPASGTATGSMAPASTTGSAAPGTSPAVTAAATNPPAAAEQSKKQYFSIVLPGSTKDLLAKMPEFHYNG